MTVAKVRELLGDRGKRWTDEELQWLLASFARLAETLYGKVVGEGTSPSPFPEASPRRTFMDELREREERQRSASSTSNQHTVPGEGVQSHKNTNHQDDMNTGTPERENT